MNKDNIKNNIKLELCPLCKSDNVKTIKLGYWQVVCDECCCSSGLYSTKLKAITAWNVRPIFKKEV